MITFDYVILEQEEGLEQLSKIISRQKQIAQTIHTEVDHHNGKIISICSFQTSISSSVVTNNFIFFCIPEIIEDLADHMDRTDDRLIQGSREIRTISRKDRVWPYWLIIILLFFTIIACALA